MDTRKIQTVGGGTYTVSLPKEWAESQEITAGDTVALHTHIDGLLVLQVHERANGSDDAVTVRIDTDDSALLERVLRAAYALGATDVTLVAAGSFTDEQRRVVERVARNLTGASVVESSETAITIRTLLDTAEVSVRQSVRQLKFVALSMHRDATAALGEPNPAGLSDRDDQADRLYALIDRSFARGLSRIEEMNTLGLTSTELFELWTTTRELERVADHAEGIVSVATRIETPVETPIIDDISAIAGLVRDLVADAVGVIVGDADGETARTVLTTRDEVREAIMALDRRLIESAENCTLRPALDRLRRTAEHGGNIAELGLRKAIRRDNLATLSDEGSRMNAPTEQ